MAGKKLNLATILEDESTYGNDIEINLANGATMTLGDIREYDKATRGSVAQALDKERRALTAREKAIEVASNEVAKTYVQVEAMKSQLEEREAGFKRTNPNVRKNALDEMLEDDPVYSRLSQEISKLQTQMADQQKAFEGKATAFEKTLNDVGATYLDEHYRDAFSRLAAKDDPVRPKDLELGTLYKYAADNGIKKRNGILDLDSAYDRMTADARGKWKEDQAFKRGQDEARKERDRENMLPRPMNTNAIPGLDNIIKGKTAPKNMDEAFAAAANDPSVWGVNQA